MAKKKKKSGRKKREERNLKDMSFEQLLEKGRQSLEAEKARNAISYLKAAGKKDGPSNETKHLLFNAYLVRSKQLKVQGLAVEAESMLQQAAKFMPSYEKMTEADLLAYVAGASDLDAFTAYAAYLSQNESCRPCERILADRLFENRQWKLADKLPREVRFKNDIPCIQQAVEQMDQGLWEKAAQTLQPVSSKSAFAPVRLFCRGMTAFLNDDEKSMRKAFSLIPEEFPLIPVINEMKRHPEDITAGESNKQTLAIRRCLWKGPLMKNQYTDQILAALKKKQLPQLKTAIDKMADVIYPRDSMTARMSIMECLWPVLLHDRDWEYLTAQLIRKILPQKQMERFTKKIMWQNPYEPFTCGGEYLTVLNREFPDPADRDTAKALILLEMVQQAVKSPKVMVEDWHGIKEFYKQLGLTKTNIKDRETILIKIAAEALRLDPNNREGYLQAAQLPHPSRKAKTEMETLLLAMTERFSDDPWPCLELASLYYEKNAYRKAENILAEAMQRAPHDNRVLERHVLALLVSTNQNIRRGRFHLAWKDIERAKQCQTPKTESLVTAKRILLRVRAEKEDIAAAIQNETQDLDFHDQLKIIALVTTDIPENALDFNQTEIRKLETILARSLKKIRQLSSSEIMPLLSPLGKEYRPLIPSTRVFSIPMIKRYKLLGFLDDADFIRIAESIILPSLFDTILKETKNRIKHSTPKHRILLEFYQAVLKQLSRNAYTYHLDDIEAVVEKADGELKEELRRIARRLAEFAMPHSSLHLALETFDFEYKHDFIDDFEDEWDDEDDEWDDEFDIMPADFENSIMSALIDLENLKNNSSRNELMKFIKSFQIVTEITLKMGRDPNNISRPTLRDFFDSAPGTRQKIKIVKKLIERYKIKDVSDDLKAFIQDGKK